MSKHVSLPLKRKSLEVEINQTSEALKKTNATTGASSQLQSPIVESNELIHPSNDQFSVESSPKQDAHNESDASQMILAVTQKANAIMSLKNYQFDQAVGREWLAKMIILHEYPLSMVDDYGFRKFLNMVSPLFNVVSRNTIKNDIKKMYIVHKEKTMEQLKKNSSRIAVTYDMWTATNQNKEYMTITAHYIDDNWVLQNRLLRFVRVKPSHTKEVLLNVLWECIYKWKIDRKLSTMIVDNCFTNDAIVDLFLRRLDRGKLMLQGSFFHMRCIAHIINLIVQDGLSVIGEVIVKIRDAIAFWIASPKRAHTFHEAVSELEIKSTKKLALDCKTRWNSTFFMLQAALIYKDAFDRLHMIEAQFKSVPSEKEWELARSICKILEIFYNATLLFSRTKFPTANIYFPTICKIKVKLSSWLTDEDDVIRKMVSQMIVKFDKYWDMIYGVLGVAIVLDPRYKTKILDYYFPLIYRDEGKTKIMRIKELCIDLFQEYQSQSMEESGISRAKSSMISSSTQTQSIVPSDLDLDFEMFLIQQSGTTQVKSELECYLEEELMPRTTPDFDVLSWWKLNEFTYPTLQKIARDVLAIPVSKVASESFFSTVGKTISPHRNKLYSCTLEALMCSHSWLWGDIKGQYQYSTIYDDSDIEDSEDENLQKAEAKEAEQRAHEH